MWGPHSRHAESWPAFGLPRAARHAAGRETEHGAQLPLLEREKQNVVQSAAPEQESQGPIWTLQGPRLLPLVSGRWQWPVVAQPGTGFYPVLIFLRG